MKSSINTRIFDTALVFPSFLSTRFQVVVSFDLIDKDASHYREEIKLVQTQPKFSTAVAHHKQTRCSNPRVTYQRDLDYVIGFFTNNINAVVVINCNDILLYLYFVNMGHGAHRSHTGGMVTMGKLGDKEFR